jgi:broad specificity phosphatase PhoE
MATVHLVRHGQASFGADDYDRLSELGWRQARRLGEHWARAGLQPAAVLTGTLRRHHETWQGIAEGAGWQRHEPLALPALDEYDSDALLAALPAQARAGLPPASTPEGFRAHFRLLRQALAAWMQGAIEPAGMPSFAAFQAGIAQALDGLRARHGASESDEIVVVSSGGPIATACAWVLGAPAETVIELNLRIRNSAVSELKLNPKRASLHTFNTVPHLHGADEADWISYA